MMGVLKATQARFPLLGQVESYRSHMLLKSNMSTL